MATYDYSKIAKEVRREVESAINQEVSEIDLARIFKQLLDDYQIDLGEIDIKSTEFANVLSKVIQQTFKTAVKQVPKIQIDLSNYITLNKSDMFKTISGMYKEILDLGDEYGDALEEKNEELAKDLKQQLLDIQQEFVKAVTVGNKKFSFREDIERLKNEKPKLVKVLNDIFSEYDSYFYSDEPYHNKFQGIKTQVLNQLKDLSKEAPKAAQQSAKQVSKEINKMTGQIESSMKEAASGLEKAGKEVGKQATESIAEGITENKDAVVKVVEDVVATASEVRDSHSTSKGAENLGETISESVQKGVEAQGTELSKALINNIDQAKQDIVEPAKEVGKVVKEAVVQGAAIDEDDIDAILGKKDIAGQLGYGVKESTKNVIESLEEAHKAIDETFSPTQIFDNEIQQDIVMLENYKNTIAEIDRLKLEPETDEVKHKLEELNKLADYFASKISTIRSENTHVIDRSMMKFGYSWNNRLMEHYNEEQREGFWRVAGERSGLVVDNVSTEFSGISEEIKKIESQSEGLRNALTKDLSESRAYVSRTVADLEGLVETYEELQHTKEGSKDYQLYQKDIEVFSKRSPEVLQFLDKLKTWDDVHAFVKTDEWNDFLATLPKAHTYLESIGYDFDRMQQQSEISTATAIEEVIQAEVQMEKQSETATEAVKEEQDELQRKIEETIKSIEREKASLASLENMINGNVSYKGKKEATEALRHWNNELNNQENDGKVSDKTIVTYMNVRKAAEELSVAQSSLNKYYNPIAISQYEKALKSVKGSYDVTRQSIEMLENELKELQNNGVTQAEIQMGKQGEAATEQITGGLKEVQEEAEKTVESLQQVGDKLSIVGYHGAAKKWKGDAFDVNQTRAAQLGSGMYFVDSPEKLEGFLSRPGSGDIKKTELNLERCFMLTKDYISSIEDINKILGTTFDETTESKEVISAIRNFSKASKENSLSFRQSMLDLGYQGLYAGDNLANKKINDELVVYDDTLLQNLETINKADFQSLLNNVDSVTRAEVQMGEQGEIATEKIHEGLKEVQEEAEKTQQQLTEQIEKANTALEEQKQQIAELEGQNESLRSSLLAQGDELQHAYEEQGSLQYGLNNAESNANILKDELNEQKQITEELKRQNEEHQKTINAMHEEMEENQRFYTAVDEELGKERERAEALEASVENEKKLRQEAEANVKFYQEMSHIAASAQVEAEEKERQTSEANIELEKELKLQKEINDQLKEQTPIIKVYDTLNENISQLVERFKELRDTLDKTVDQFKEMYDIYIKLGGVDIQADRLGALNKVSDAQLDRLVAAIQSIQVIQKKTDSQAKEQPKAESELTDKVAKEVELQKKKTDELKKQTDELKEQAENTPPAPPSNNPPTPKPNNNPPKPNNNPSAPPKPPRNTPPSNNPPGGGNNNPPGGGGKGKNPANTRAIDEAIRYYEKLMKTESRFQELVTRVDFGQEISASAKAQLRTYKNIREEEQNILARIQQRSQALNTVIHQYETIKLQERQNAELRMRDEYTNEINNREKALTAKLDSGKYSPQTTDKVAGMFADWKLVQDAWPDPNDVKHLQLCVEQLKQMDETLEKAGNETKLRKLLLDVTSTINDNSKMSGEMRHDFDNLGDSIRQALDTGATQDQVQKLQNRFLELKNEMIKTGQAGKSFVGMIFNDISTASARMIAQYLSFQDWIRYFRQAISAVNDLDKALNQLKIVSGEASGTLNSIADSAYKLANSLGMSTTEVVSSITEWRRLGKTIDESMILAEQAARLSTGGLMDISSATTALVSSMQAFEMQADEVNKVVDQYIYLGKQLPVDNYIG